MHDVGDMLDAEERFRDACTSYVNQVHLRSATVRRLFRSVRLSSSFDSAVHRHIGQALWLLRQPHALGTFVTGYERETADAAQNSKKY